jgi:hypothetical protein
MILIFNHKKRCRIQKSNLHMVCKNRTQSILRKGHQQGLLLNGNFTNINHCRSKMVVRSSITLPIVGSGRNGSFALLLS